uniref:Cytosolic fatty-acid binding proteins domain-containing protein n=1 Tax=Pectinophora gossypiella TaxID=13191 RepID=A0A1E1WE07_PECGO
MSYLGKEYHLESQENFEAFLDTFGPDAPEAFKKAMLNQKAFLKLVKNGDSYTLYTNSVDNTTKELTFKSGVEFDEQLRGNACKTTITVDGNVVTQVQKFDNGVVMTIKREFTDNQLVATITMSQWDGVAKRIYKA